MSFFFSKPKPRHSDNAPVKAKGALAGSLGATPAAKRNLPSLWRLGCAACPLQKAGISTPRMTPTLAPETLVYFLAEAPDAAEDENTGKPLTGPSGKLLRECIPDDEESICSFDNFINCRPPKDRTPVWQEIECCRPRRIKWIEESKPKLIVGLGLVPLHALLGSTDMDGMRGRFFAVKMGNHTCWFMPTYHPSYIAKKAFDERNPLKSKLGHCFKMDIKRAFEYARKLKKPQIDSDAEIRKNIQCFDGTHKDHFHGLLTLLKRATAAPLKSIDLETKGLRPFKTDAAIMTAAVSHEDTNFSFAIDHPKAGWSTTQRQQILKAFEALLRDKNSIKVAHNLPFEMEWLIWLYGKDIADHAGWECTQVQAHFIDERRGKQTHGDDSHRAAYQSLDFLCKQHFGVSYKSSFKLNKKDMSQADLGETLIYNAVDTKYTLRLYLHQEKLLHTQGLHAAYLDALPRQVTVALMQTLGIGVDQPTVKMFQSKLEGEIQVIEDSIFGLKVVKAFITAEKEFRPSANDDVLKILKEYLHYTEITSVGKEVLEKIDHPLAQSILKLRNKAKLKSTYIDPLELGAGEHVYPDGLIHCNFNTTFAETGRTSCVAGWTPIVTAKGTIPISKVQIGDLVWTHKERWRKVTALWCKGVKPMLQIKLQNGQFLTCTKNHRLLTSGGAWEEIGDIYGLFQEMGIEREKSTRCPEPLPKQRAYINYRYSKQTDDKGGQCPSSCKAVHHTGGIQSVKISTLLGLQTGGEKPHERENVRKTPALGWAMSGWPWVLDDTFQWQKGLCTPRCVPSSAWFEGDARWFGGSPHRREQNQQFFGQPCTGNLTWSQINTLQAVGNTVIEIEEIKTSGSFEVFDITVDEDASYLSCGVFSHNSDQPNMQNFPQRNDSWVRQQVVAGPGHVLLAFDYGQLEACTAAMCSQDKVLVKALWEDYDIHMEWSEKTAHKYPAIVGGKEGIKDKALMKKLRSKIKNKLVFPAIFGAQNKSIAGYLNMPEDIIDSLMKEFWATFNGLHSWQNRLMKKYYETGSVESFVGRAHRYPLTRNQAINHPVQCLAAEIVCNAMNCLSEKAIATNNWHIHPRLNIHDDLSFIIPDDDALIENCIKQIYTIMLTPPYTCVNVPLAVKASIGNNWYQMTEVGQFWSHRDL